MQEQMKGGHIKEDSTAHGLIHHWISTSITRILAPNSMVDPCEDRLHGDQNLPNPLNYLVYLGTPPHKLEPFQVTNSHGGAPHELGVAP